MEISVDQEDHKITSWIKISQKGTKSIARTFFKMYFSKTFSFCGRQTFEKHSFKRKLIKCFAKLIQVCGKDSNLSFRLKRFNLLLKNISSLFEGLLWEYILLSSFAWKSSITNIGKRRMPQRNFPIFTQHH